MKRKHPATKPAETVPAMRPYPFSRVPGLHDGFYAGKHDRQGKVYWFVSLDGELWVESNRDPRGDTRADVELLFEPGFWRPIRMTTRFLMHYGPFEILEPRTPVGLKQHTA